MADLWRYHLGVHKTATTHLQRVLEGQRKELLEQGIDYIPLKQLRSDTDRIFRRRAFKQSQFRRATHSHASVAILSEENWLGYVQDACAAPIYVNLERRLEIISRPNAIAFLAIRNPADFAASAYSEALRHAPNQVSLEATRTTFLSTGSPWVELIERIEQFFPRLYVWKYEDYRRNEEAYISAVAGTRVKALRVADPLETTRLPAQTIEALEKMRAAGRELPKAGTFAPPVDPTRFEMFSDREREELTKAYNRDLETLKLKGRLITL